MSKTTAHRVKQYADFCAMATAQNLPLPLKEYHIRPIYRLAQTDQPVVWRLITDATPLEQITPYLVASIVTHFLQTRVKGLQRSPYGVNYE